MVLKNYFIFYFLIIFIHQYVDAQSTGERCVMAGNPTQCPDGSGYSSVSNEATRNQIVGNFQSCMRASGLNPEVYLPPDAVTIFERNCQFAPRNQPLAAGQFTNRLLMDQFFQNLAQRSSAQIKCRIDSMDLYINGDATRKNEYHQRASQAYARIREQLEPLAHYKQQLERDAIMSEGYAMSGSCMPPYNATGDCVEASMNSGFSRGTLTNVNAQIARLCVQMPYGYEPEMCDALVNTALTGRYDSDIIDSGVRNVRTKYFNAQQTYCNNTLPAQGDRGYYCLSDSYRQLAVQSGQARALLDSYPPEALVGNSRTVLRCQLESEYSVSVSRRNWGIGGITVLGVIASAVPTGGGSVAVATGAAGAIAGVIGLAAQLEVAYEACSRAASDSTYLISAEGGSCNPEANYQRAIDQASWSSCLTSSGLAAVSAISIPGNITRLVSARRANPRIRTEGAADDATNSGDIVVTAVNPVRRAVQGRIDRATESGRLRMIDGDGNPVPLDVEFGRYYAVGMVPGQRLVAISEAPTRHGSHALLMRNAFGRTVRPLDDSVHTGGVIFNANGTVQISGQSLRYPSQAAANALARQFRRMGFRVEYKTSGPIRETIQRPAGATESGNWLGP